MELSNQKLGEVVSTTNENLQQQIATNAKQKVERVKSFNDFGFDRAGKNAGDFISLKAYLGWIKDGHIIEDGYNENEQHLLKNQLENKIVAKEENKNTFAEDPMLRSGLIFAGANKYWGKNSTTETIDNGVLTASEISNLDFSACQLVVLSACETGLGDINGSDGVFGLQRAFKMAGVKNIIMSMWKVPDAQTAELFAIFYQSCFAGKSIHEAFQGAQAEMKQKYAPYYWAGFVLME